MLIGTIRKVEDISIVYRSAVSLPISFNLETAGEEMVSDEDT